MGYLVFEVLHLACNIYTDALQLLPADLHVFLGLLEGGVGLLLFLDEPLDGERLLL